jgi:Proteasome non-ATPase 26S subunit
VNNRDATQLVLSLAKSPFVETRLGTYALLEAVAKQGTGAQVLLSHDGFYDFLVSRESERIKEGKEAKFAIVQAIMDSPARGLLADSIVNTLDKILKQGPHYVKAVQEELMTE